MATRSNGKHYLILFVEDNAGVLSRITSLFCQRGFNIDTLTVASTDHEGISRITISFYGDERTCEQLIMQTGKLIEVKHVISTETPFCLLRELLLVKIEASEESEAQIQKLVEENGFHRVDNSEGYVVLELIGDPLYIDTMLDLLRSFRIVEMCRTGVTAIERGRTSYSLDS